MTKRTRRRTKAAAKPRVRIIDLPAVRRAAAWVIDHRVGPWRENALAIGQTTLARLKRGTHLGRPITHMTEATYTAVLDALGRANSELYHGFVRGVITPMGTEIGIGWEMWLSERSSRLAGRHGAHYARDGRDVREVRGDATRARQAVRRSCEAYIESKGLGPLLEKFRQRMAKRGHKPVVIDLSVLRILEPLLESPESAFVERHWTEISDQELRNFLLAGIRRESIMLNRAPGLRRVQELQ